MIAYTFLYGGILGQEITNVTERDHDVSSAIQVGVLFTAVRTMSDIHHDTYIYSCS